MQELLSAHLLSEPKAKVTQTGTAGEPIHPLQD